MRVAFMGTPGFAVPSLQAVLEHHDVALVVSRPDRPSGRGLTMRRSPVAAAAEAAGVALELPEKVRRPEVIERVRQARPDVLVVAAFGQILPVELLQVALHGGLNVHASLLPRWRGASPIAAAILAGDAETGVSIMRMEAGLDTGPVLLQRGTAILPGETTGELTERLAKLGAEALLDGLAALEQGNAVFTPQAEEGVTVAPLVRKQQGDLDWSRGAAEIERAVRAFDPWPGVRVPLAGEPVRLLRAKALPAWATGDGSGALPGDILEVDRDGIVVMAGDGPVRVEKVQAPGKRAMAASEYARGRREITVTGRG
jgi:methionyl-tRNA formyltransferase